MPDEKLFSLLPVALTPSIGVIVSRAGARARCSLCGEEIINQREIEIDGLPYCRACLGQAYYRVETEERALAPAMGAGYTSLTAEDGGARF